jgi:signal transduction histidine kinase
VPPHARAAERALPDARASASTLLLERARFLAEASRTLAQSLDYETTLATVAGLATPELGAWVLVDLVEEDGAVRRLAVVHPDPAKQALARELERGYPPAVEDALGAPVVLRTREPVLVPEVTDDLLIAAARDARHLEILRTLGMGSFMVVAMVARGEVVGSMTFVSAESGRRYDADDLALVEDLATRCAFAVDNARLYRAAERARGAVDVERERLRIVVLQTPAPLALLEGPELRFALVNDAYKRVSGGGRDVTGLTPRTAFPELAGSGIHELFDQVYATGEPWVGPETLVRYDRDGTGVQDTWFDLRFEPVRDAGGRVVGVFNFAVDVTDQVRARRQTERLLADAQAARAEAEAANRAKGEFMAVMSHELRTPLNAIGGYAELMELGIHGPVTAEQGAALARIQRSQRHLLGLVNEVLNYAKLETGAVRYEIRDVAVCDAVTEAEGLILPQARAKGLALAIDDCPGDLTVRADPEKLRQVLVNLLSNAIKFTNARAGLARDVSVTCAAGPDGRVAIRVRDTGIGIAADKLGSIFEPFVQVRSDLTRTAEGTGLGLAISRDLARGMDGDLTVESTLGVGSTFTLTLPAA